YIYIWMNLGNIMLSEKGGTRKCWNLHGKCRHKCSRKERIYVYCTNSKMCCVKPKYQPKDDPRFFGFLGP
uniref:Beta-defensin n=1 Tax=Equus asinus asinus TaxID=83772 RepID=A0A8C4L2K8_EQUAS